MKYKYLMSLVSILIWGVMTALGQNNTITIPDVSVAKGRTISLPINMDNTADVVAVQFTLSVPQGLTIDASSATLSDRSDDHFVTFRSIGTNKYMAMIFSAKNKAIKGRTGKLLSVSLTASNSVEETLDYPLVLSDVVIGARDGLDLTTGYKAGKVNIATSPDLEISNVAISENKVMPNGKLNVSWTVTNVGGYATKGGWSEQILLKNGEGTTKLIGTLYHNEPINASGEVSRTAELNIPAVLGMDGDCHVVVKILPNSDAGEPSWLQTNNSSVTNTTVSVGKMIVISPEQAVVDEATSKMVKFHLSRSGDTTNDAVFSLSYDADSRLSFPESITIEKGMSSVYFYAQVAANSVLDENQKVQFTVSGNDYPEVVANIEIEDDTNPNLNITTEQQDVTEGGTIVFKVATERAQQNDIEIKMTCDFPKRFGIPSNIVIPAGETSVDVTVEAVEDDVPDAEQVVTFTVNAARHNPASIYTVLVDNDVPTLQLEITPNAVSEAVGPLAVTAKLRRTNNIDKVVTVKLSDDSDGGIYYGRQTITLEKGVEEVTVNLGPIDNAAVDGERTYNISAAVWIASCSCNANNGTSGGVVSVPLTVYDNDGPTLTMTSSSSILKEGGEITVTVKRNTDSTDALAVSMSSDHDAYIEFPNVVTIPAGDASVSFVVKSKDNDIMGDGFTAMLNAIAEGFAKGNVWFTVSDQTLPDAQIADFSISADNVEVNGTINAEVTVTNSGSYELPELTKVGIYISNSSSAVTTLYIQNALQPGETVVLNCDITVPSVIGKYNVHAIVNDGNEVKELNFTNNISKMLTVKTVSPFTIAVNTDKNVYKSGEKALIYGNVTGSDVSLKDVEVYIINDNYRHVINTKTDNDGAFTVQYEPYSGQMGHFIAGACYPKEGLLTEMAAFDYYGIKRVSNSAITCDALFGETYSGSFAVSNPGMLPLTGVMVEVVSKPENCNVTVNCPNSINANSTFNIYFAIDATAVSEGNDWQKIDINIISDEGISLPTTLYYYCRCKTGQLKANVTRINTTMIKGTSRDYPFTITNTGKGESGKITLELPSWMSSVTPREMSPLNSGESTTVILRLTPTENMQLNVPVSGSIGINCSNGQGMSLPFYIEPVSESNGTLIIDVCDENTYYTSEKPHLAGASVTVSHPTTGATIAFGTTGEDGMFRAILPEGYYSVSVSAPNHNSYRNNLLVDPGVENLKTINLSIEAITIDWKVEETTVQDEYSIVTTVKYETSVPVPVVEISMPQNIDAKNLSEGESLIFYATLTNKGLITAEDVQLELPTGFRLLQFEALAFNAPFSLAPQQSVLIPIRVTHIGGSMAKPIARAKPIDNDPCIGQVGTLYYWDCGMDRKWHRYGIALQLGPCDSNDPSTWDNSGNGTYGGGGYGYRPVYRQGIGGGYFGSSSNSSNVTTNQDEGCEPCQNRELMKWVECGLSFIPVYGCVKGTGDCAREAIEGDTGWRHNTNCVLTGIGCTMDLCAGESLSTIVGAPVAAACEIIGFITNVIGCLIPFTEPCDREASQSKAGNSKILNANEPSYLTAFRKKAEIPLQEMTAWSEILTEIFGESVWVSNTTMGELYELLTELYLSEERVLNAKKYLSFKPERITVSEFERFIERLNNTDIIESGESIESSNYINSTTLKSLYCKIDECESTSMSFGYKSTDDMWLTEASKCKEELEKNASSVCASVSLQFSQKMVMTRQAFRGTLTVFNGNETTAMTDVKLNLIVKDEKGNVATKYEFQISPEMLNGFKGNLSLEDGWTLDAQQTGVATILFIPTKYAAPMNNRLYSFGGSLSYVDPFTGLTVTRDLSPVTLTVKPSPNLDLTYFMQRDIKGDDPLTEEIEPSEEAEFSLLINNVGYGDATDVRMFTEQPKIIDNEKGLLVDFELMSSQLNGGEKTLALGGRVATDFGTIPAKSTSYAQWWLKSSLLGHFTSYNVEATHVTSYGNPDLSLLNDVTIHELIRSIEVEADGKKLVGFLTNDIADADDTPDMIYLSDGEIETVSTVKNAVIQKLSDTDYALNTSIANGGWYYGSVVDPTYGMSALKSVTRQSDGKQMPLRNFWQTDRTLRDGKDPLYENRIHFVDETNTVDDETYILTFEPTPELLLDVAAIDNVPEEGSLSIEPLKCVKVVFNKRIDPATFTSDDISLAVQGVKQDVSSVVISTEDDKTFSVDFSAINENVGNGYFVFKVNTSDVMDIEGFYGKNGKQAGWIMFRDGFVSLTTATYPQTAGMVQKLSDVSNAKAMRAVQSKDDSAEYGSTVRLTTTPNDGYEFKNWTVNGEIISTDPILEYVALGDMDVKANYSLQSLSVTVGDVDAGGYVSGSASGVYSYGDVLSFKAVPDDDYVFVGWTVNGKDYGEVSELKITIDEAKEIKAEFRRDVFQQSLVVSRGWNWVSSYVSEPIPVGNILGNVTHIVSQFDEIIQDPQYGMIGAIESLVPGVAYKMNASYSSLKSFKGHLHNLTTSPIELHTGWNWISYPYMEEKNINDVLPKVSEGDYITSQLGFSEYADGYWEGTLNVLTPGVGYIYKSSTDKTLMFDFSEKVLKSKVSYHDFSGSSYPNDIDIHKYPSTMNIVARISTEFYDIDETTSRIYAFAGDECRGESQYVSGNHYLTIYGDEAATITFAVENLNNGNTYLAKENVTFSQQVLGSRKAPFVITPVGTTGMANVNDSLRKMRIYSIEGVLINPEATTDSLKRLKSGIYIVDGQKFVVK